jgi:heptosyltransferase II
MPPPRPLIVRLRNWIGDVVLGLPALSLLEAHGYQLQLVGKGWASALLAGHGWAVHTKPTGLRERVAQLRDLKREAMKADPEFTARDNMLVLPTSFSSALDARLAGLRAVGYAQEARGMLLRRAEPITYGGHALTSYWSLACRFLRIDERAPASITLRTHPADQQAADALLAQHGITPGFVVVVPFAGGQFEKQEKTWPEFAAFTQALRSRISAPLVACPGPGEASIIHSHHAGIRVLDGVKLGVYGGLLRRASLVISNDTGPAHLAAAVGTRVISVLGPTKPEQWAPWGPHVQVLRHWPRWPNVDEVLAPTLAAIASPSRA